MVRLAVVVASLTVLGAAAPAQAFEACDHDGTTVTATFGTDTVSRIAVSGGAIVTEAGQCDGATVANTDTIEIVTSPSRQEELTIDLSGGPFLGGVTNEAGGSDEIEIEAPVAEGFDTIIVRGHDGDADHVTLGGTTAQKAFNLNANEADGVDADVTAGDWFVGIEGRAGNDTLSDAGGDATGPSYSGAGLVGGPGDDALDCGGTLRTGQGNDTATFRTGEDCYVSYDDAPGPVRVALGAGAGGDWGGTLAGHDGFGTTDTYVGQPRSVSGSAFGDVLDGSGLGDRLSGADGPDTINGGGADDDLDGGDGVDTMHGNDGADELYGAQDGDEVHGDDGDDIVDGGNGTDVELGGPGDDRHRQSGYNQRHGEESDPNGPDDISGGPGRDTLEYADLSSPSFGFGDLLGRAAPVTVDLDDVADDGANGEGDNARSDLEDVVGGLANDTLTGDGDANVLSGFDGADTLRGGGGDDTLEGLGSRTAWAPQVEEDAEDEADDIDGGPGNDTVLANEGGDVIAARDGVAENVDCGPGEDTGTRDASDVLTACEGLALPVEMPPDPPVAPPGDPPAQPAPPVVTPPVVVPAPPKVATLLSLPSSRRCASRRKFTVRVRREIRGTVERVQIFLNGKRVKSVTGSRIGLPIDLRGLPKGKVKVRLRVELKDGRVATDTRTYRTCATKKRKGRFG